MWGHGAVPFTVGVIRDKGGTKNSVYIYGDGGDEVEVMEMCRGLHVALWDGRERV